MNTEKFDHTEQLQESAQTQSKFERVLGKMPDFFEHMKKNFTKHEDGDTEKIEQRATKKNVRLQRIYDSAIASGQEDWQIATEFENFNLAEESPFLASGQSGYFNEQIDKHGMSGLKLRKQDLEDAKYIAKCFGRDINTSDDELDILYTTLPGTTEMNYATQTFPAMIMEDVFQCSENHTLPIPPKVGEKEEAYWARVLNQKIAETGDFPISEADEVKLRGTRLISIFCKGKNRVYLIPIKDLLENKASFGDAVGLRGGVEDISIADALQDTPSLQELASIDDGFINAYNLYNDPNFTSEYGVAIYGQIQSDNLEYIEVERGYDTLQRQALQAGLKEGEDISLS